jgi:peptide chain release factor 3
MLEKELGPEGYKQLRDEAELLEAAGDAFDAAKFARGEVSPMFFGSAINNFGLEAFLESFCKLMPPPTPRMTSKGELPATDPRFSGFVFKIQSNMDRAHRDRVAFVRICSGRFERGMKVRHVRTGREIRLANPTQFVAQERNIVDEAYAGDVLGVYDPGVFEIGDTVTDAVGGQGDFTFEDIPSFAPEHFARLVMADPMRRKQLQKGIEQLGQEGTIQLYRPPDSRAGDIILGAVGQLQLEVVKHRLKSEYEVDIRYEPISVLHARWITRKDGAAIDLQSLTRERIGLVVVDVRERPVVLFSGDWQLNAALKEHPEYVFAETARGVVMRKE